MIATATESSTHVLSHLGIFAAYMAAMGAVPSSFKRLMAIRPITMISGAGFFLLCGMTHLSIVLDLQNNTVFVISDDLQVLAIWSFLVLLAGDLSRASRRLTQAFLAIRTTYGEDVGDTLTDTIQSALKD